MYPQEFNAYSHELRLLMTRMLSKNIEERPSSTACLMDSWFNPLNLKKEESKVDERVNATIEIEKESAVTRYRLREVMSLKEGQL